MTIDITTDEFRQNPYPVYQRLRREEPVVFAEKTYAGPAWLITRYNDAVTVLKDPCFSSNRLAVKEKGGPMDAWWMPKTFRALSNSMIVVDDPDHRRLRDLVHMAFTPQMIRRLASRIEAISHELLDQALKKASVELIADFALPLPLTVISEMMGVPEKDRLKFHKWSAAFLDASFDDPMSMLQQLPNAFQLNRLFKQLIHLRQRHPADDLITALVQAEDAGDRLSEEELVAMLFLLLLAGHETTVNLIASGTLALLENPDELSKLKARPELMDSAVEELLRYTTPVEILPPRYALEDTVIGDFSITRGQAIVVSLASANRDETIFEQADELEIERHPNKHLSFGLGIHYCLGAPLARLEGKIALQVLLDRCPGLALAALPEELKWRNSAAVRGLKVLPVYLGTEEMVPV